MSRYHSYLNSATRILGQYDGQQPFAAFLKQFFAADKKFGSKDRKQVSHLCYCYYRLGGIKFDLPLEECVLAGLFLCTSEPSDILQVLKPDWNEKVSANINEKLSLIQPNIDPANLFPLPDELSDTIDVSSFCLSHFQQPDLFLRMRPGKEGRVKQQLTEAGIDFRLMHDSCLALPNASKIDDIVSLNKDAVVQDYSSQRTAAFFPSSVADAWDCCAASGGKSIMLYDHCPTVRLTVSDIRESILANLKKRFAEAGIANYKRIVTNLANGSISIAGSPFDLVIADLPCSGSGTWGRAPENLVYFDREKLLEYAALQKKISLNVISHVKPGGRFLYITCSVYKKENEETVEFIQQNTPLVLERSELLKGYDKKADTMFAALFVRPAQ